jgi:hypothetical protein
MANEQTSPVHSINSILIFTGLLDLLAIGWIAPQFLSEVYADNLGFVWPNLESVSHYAVVAVGAPLLIAFLTEWENVFYRRRISILPCARLLVANTIFVWIVLIMLANSFGRSGCVL